jgi:hypothetical protein
MKIKLIFLLASMSLSSFCVQAQGEGETAGHDAKMERYRATIAAEQAKKDAAAAAQQEANEAAREAAIKNLDKNNSGTATREN